MKEKKQTWADKHPVLAVIIALLFVGSVVSALTNDQTKTSTPSTTTTNSAASSTNKTAERKVAKIGQPVRDGKFEFTINKIGCGETSVGSRYSTYKAQGQFCRVNITVKNIGNEAQTLSHNDQYAYTADGKKYSADSSAAIYADTDSSNSWYTDINPGNIVSGDVFFDMPKGTEPIRAELHDDFLSGGISVDLK